MPLATTDAWEVPMQDGESELLRGKVVAVLRGSIGTCEALSKLIAKHGASVVVHGLPGDPVAEVVRDIEAAGGAAVGCVADLGTTEGAECLVRTAVSTYGKLDVLIVRGGLLPGTALDERSRDRTPLPARDRPSGFRIGREMFYAARGPLR
jgi:NAD(P)-dependent dehydrogenase (short-subunit alcohol dehydrogenase family)